MNRETPRLFTKTDPLVLDDGALIAQGNWSWIAPWDDVYVRTKGGVWGWGISTQFPEYLDTARDAYTRLGTRCPMGGGCSLPWGHDGEHAW